MKIEIREWNGDWRWELEDSDGEITYGGILHTLDECYEEITEAVNAMREEE